jgi:hypothetical protein
MHDIRRARYKCLEREEMKEEAQRRKDAETQRGKRLDKRRD